MKRCENCGTTCQDYAQICPTCGRRLPAARQNVQGGMTVPNGDPGMGVPGGGRGQQMGGGGRPPRYQDDAYGGNPYYNLPSRFDHTAQFPRDTVGKEKAQAVIPYFLGVLGLIISSFNQKSEYVQFHVRQQTRYTLLSTMINLFFAVLVGLISFFAGFGMPSFYSSEMGGIWLLAHMIYGFYRTGTACSVIITIQLLLQLAVYVLRVISAIRTLAGSSVEALLVRHFL